MKKTILKECMKKTILLIDDSQTQLTSLKTTVAKLGFEVITTNNGSEGISLVYQKLPDLIICDVFMPEINGYQLCRLLRSDNLTKNVPIILITSRKEKIGKFWALRSGADALVVKEGSFDISLEKEIERIFNNVTGLSDEERKKLSKSENVIPVDYIQQKINHLLDQSLIESTIINEFRNLSEIVQNPKILKNGFFSLLSAILDYSVAGIFFNERDDKKEKVLSLTAYDVELDESTVQEIKKDFFNLVCQDEYSLNEDLYVTEKIENIHNNVTIIDNVSKFKSKSIIPIVFGNKVLGGLCVYHLSPDKFVSSKVLNIVCDELKILMRIKWLYSETRYLAITDGLTNLYNRRYFQQTLEREFSRAKRHKLDLSVVMLDIDHFKRINDTYGHQFGDKILSELSRIVKYSLRKTDYVARYGGEEIIAILPDTSLKSTKIPVERMAININQNNFKYGDEFVRVTVSIGVASITNNVTNEQELILRADKCLYNAKENGRNRIEYYQE